MDVHQYKAKRCALLQVLFVSFFSAAQALADHPMGLVVMCPSFGI